MPDESDGDNPTADSPKQPSFQSPVSPSTPEQNKMGEKPECCPNNKNNQTTKLERDIKTGEICLIVINGLLLIATIVIACIYYGQLTQMRNATEASTEATKIAANQLEGDQRPWLTISKVDIETVDTSDPSHPGFALGYDVRNSGKGIATLYGVYAQLWLDLGPDPDGEEKRRRDTCDDKWFTEHFRIFNSHWGIMPSPYTFDYEGSYGINKNLPTVEIKNPRDPVDVRITGCIFYRYNLRNDKPSQEMHHTPFLAAFAPKTNGECPPPNSGNSKIVFATHPTKNQLCVRYVEVGSIDGITP